MKALKVATALTLSGAFLTSCSSMEPLRDTPEGLVRPVSIGIVEGSVEQTLLGELYARVLAEEDREVNVTTVDTTRVDSITRREVDFIIGCTGELLDKFDPTTAQDLHAQREDGDSPEVVGVEEYEMLMHALPTGLRSTDVSTARGCEEQEDASDDLSQNIVPIFQTGLFNRDELFEIRGVTLLLTDEDLTQMREDVQDGATPREAVAKWYGTRVVTEEEHA